MMQAITWGELKMRMYAQFMNAVLSYQVQFSEMLPDNKGYMNGDTIYIPESQAYKLIFMNNRVDDLTVKFAIDHAIAKVNRFIDNIKA